MMRKLAFTINTAGQSARHMSHKSGVNRSLKRHAAKLVRCALKREVAAQFAEVDDDLEQVATPSDYEFPSFAVLDVPAALDELETLLARTGRTTKDIQYVSNGGAWCSWDEFVASVSDAIDCCGLSDIHVVGDGWFALYGWTEFGFSSWRMCLIPVRPLYHLPSAFRPDYTFRQAA